MKRLLSIVSLLAMFCMDYAEAELPNIDRTCTTCSRRYLDSLNVYNRRPIRMNQSGFRPQDYKYAYVADPKEMTFKVIDANSGKEVPGGGNLSLIKKGATKPNIWINGAFNSLESIYEFGKQDSISTEKEDLYRADFTTLSTTGEYFLVVGKDTSATFHVHPSIYNSILENSLQFFGIQRCGNTDSHFHKPCHLKDGSKVGHDLTGGWHDCGDHFKVSETLGYTAYVLSMVYLTYPNKAEDRYGHSYADTVFTDGIPDILYEAKIGADYILKLYKASKADGLIENNDMYHSVGVDEKDHSFWDLPERQDAQPESKGGPDRVVLTGIGANTSGMFVAALANVAAGYRVYDPAYSDTLIEAAKDIYKNVMMPLFDYGNGNEMGKTTSFPGFYTGGGPRYDDGAAAALALWYATKDTTYRYDLYKNTNIFNNPTNSRFNLDYFKAGFLGNESGFSPGGWATDYQNIHTYVLFAFQNLILKSTETAAEFGLTEIERDSLSMRTMATFRKILNDATNQGDSTVLVNPGVNSNEKSEAHEGPTDLKVITPYNLVWTSFDWGVIRYNLGTAVSIFLMYELTKDERYLKVALDNMYYALGANPWDISLLMGAGDKNPQHPHNRSANPDGFNTGGMPYQYRCPKGALMGGRDPEKTLIEDWSKYTSTETCIDFSAQFLFPAQSLAETLPPDNEGPLFSNIVGTPITDSTAIVSWDANEVALVTVFYDVVPNSANPKSVQQTTASKGGSVTLTGLIPGQTYYFFLEGMDTKRNITTDDNHGYWYSFTMTPKMTEIKGVTICQVDHRSAKIYWWSTDRLNGVVNYGKAKGAYTETQNASGSAVLFHEAELTGLEAGTTYYFTVSSGAKTSEEYSFTTETHATYADLDISLKPSSYSNEAACSQWQDCHAFIMSLSNNDTVPFEDFEVRMYLKDPNLSALGNSHQNFGGDGQMGKPISVTFGSAQEDGFGGYYLPINVKGKLEVSGQLIIQIIFHNYDPNVKTVKFKDIEGSWSLRAHTEETDPEHFEGIDLTQAPYFKGSETTFLEHNSNGEKVVAFTRDPYITVYYHGKHIYGYGPDYTPENGPQVKRTIETTFTSPFVSPRYSVEREDPLTTYAATSKVSPTGVLDAVEMNSNPYKFEYPNTKRTDSIAFGTDTTLAYGNNYMEWVTWHNRNANMKDENKYDCACAVVRSNVEIDSITKPLEKRYLVFDKSNIVGYKDKFIEVQISLLDSNLELYKDEKNLNVELVSDDPNVLFYTDPTATIPVTTITLYDGVATIYVSSKVAVKTTISATHANTADYAYTPAVAELDIEELPPWPIIDVAKIVDLNCDHIPDAMDITLSSEYTANQSFTSISFTYGNTTINANKVKSLNGKSLVVEFDDIKDIVTNATGKITLTSNIEGQVKTVEDSYSDGIPPALLSATVLERQDTANADHVYLQFSEPISAPGTNFPLILYAADGITKAATPTVLSAKLYNESKNIWDFEIAFDASNNSVVTAGMWGQLDPAGSIKDLNGNGVAGLCTPEKVEILLKILPIPMTYAVITDKDKNGYASHVDVQFSKALDAKHTPDTLEIIFGIAKPETLKVEKSKFALNGENLAIDLEKPFQFGNTAGNYDGALPGGKMLTHAGLVTQYLGTGAATESNSVLAEDKVGPVFVSATINQTNSADVLNITVSEPLVVADSTQEFYRHKRAERLSNAFSSNFSAWSFSQSNSSLTFLYMNSLAGTVMEGDYVRMGSMMTSTFKDANGNYPEFDVPWVLVNGKGAPKIKFDVHLRETVTDANSLNRSKVNTDETMRFYIRNPSNNKFDLIQGGKVTQTAIDSADIGGAIFDVKLTVPRGSSFGEECAWESLLVKFSIPIYSNLGNFVNRFKQAFSVDPKQYLSTNNLVEFAIEWANKAPSGIRTKDDRAVGTGAYIYKAEIEATFTPNMNNPDVKGDEKLIKNFSTKSSFDQTKTFGIKRTK
ncbi:glycoside hydrolase family 9 protein [uncultured Fibrobacter sp.]|uniref:glycoside hydrolase family 9 protein n=1 Tax=uncultured Fibrobacter sp. TaxID=261512 RepID=UPI0025EB4B00|nr:glycoside hydrolase family 9 protein [uncultured Fibrobacter sp.]